jgi:translation initiation factor 2 subunit 1
MRGKEEYPEIGDFVVCTVQNVKNFGAFVSLDEYGGKEGFIHITEVATGWVKYIRDYVREGQKIVCKVLVVDPSKEHVDLSLKVINDHQRREKIHLWKDEQKAQKLLDIVATKIGKSAEDMMSEEDYDKIIETYGTLYKAFEESVINKKALEEAGFKGDWIKDFGTVANENIEPPLVDIAGFLELTCYKPDGVSHIKTALTQIEKKMGKDGAEVIVQYIGAPRYRVQVRAKNYKTAEDVINKAAEKAINYISKHNGEGKFAREAKK